MKLLAAALLALCPISAVAQTPPADNAEMERLFNADQAVRKNVKPEQYKDRAFVQRMLTDDRARLARTRAILGEGGLATGQDFYAAAFVFQHGSTPADYLLAHSLALAAVARGKGDARWIAAATLDRYLQAIGQQQIYGTQYVSRTGTPVTQEPYDRTLVPDSLRAALAVPDQAAQQARLTAMQAGTEAK